MWRGASDARHPLRQESETLLHCKLSADWFDSLFDAPSLLTEGIRKIRRQNAAFVYSWMFWGEMCVNFRQAVWIFIISMSRQLAECSPAIASSPERIPPQLPTYVSGDSPPQTEVFSTRPY